MSETDQWWDRVMGENLGKGWMVLLLGAHHVASVKPIGRNLRSEEDALIRIVAGGSPPRPDVMMAEFYVC